MLEKKSKPFASFLAALSVFRFKTLAVVVLGLALSGCGFTPLYATKSSDNTANMLGGILIDAPSDRETQLITNALSLTLPANKKNVYKLSLTSSSAVSDLAIERDSRVTRANFSQRVKFELIDITTRQTILQGTSTSAASYNKVASEFANDQAQLNARERTAKAIAEDMKMQMALALKKNAAPQRVETK